MKVLKGSPVPMMIQNLVLYSCGVVLSLLSYFSLEHPLDVLAATAAAADSESASGDDVDLRQKEFFEGYSFLAVVLILFQAFHGLAVAAVYKYADVLVKNFASSMTMANL
eukprot:479043-Prymnesium_polylepis.1